jgi:hypothetical protein
MQNPVRLSLVLVLALLATAGCANLTAVRDFSKLTSEVTASTPAIQSYPAAMREMARLAPPNERATRNAEARAAVDETKVAELGLKTLSLYFAALAKLADDSTISAPSSNIGNSLQSLGAIKQDMAAPTNAIVNLLTKAALDGWRRQAVAKLIEGANESVSVLAEQLANFAKSVAQVYDRDISEAEVYYSMWQARSADPGVRAILDEYRVARIADYARSRDVALAAEVALRRIRQAQADLYAHRSDLNGAELKGLLATYGDDIKQAAKILPLPFQL